MEVGYDLFAAIFVVALTPFVVAGFVVFWAVTARDHEELASCWRSYARKHGLAFEEPEGDWPNRTAPAIAWTDGGTELRISAHGREARVRTRLTVRPRSALLGTLTMALEETGDPELVRERPPGFSRRILTDRVRRALLGFRQRDSLALSYRRGRVAVEWPGGERNDARLDEARRLGVEIAHTVEDQFRATATAESVTS